MEGWLIGKLEAADGGVTLAVRGVNQRALLARYQGELAGELEAL